MPSRCSQAGRDELGYVVLTGCDAGGVGKRGARVGVIAVESSEVSFFAGRPVAVELSVGTFPQAIRW